MIRVGALASLLLLSAACTGSSSQGSLQVFDGGQDTNAQMPGCSDGVTSGDESDVDCGGYICVRCAEGSTCNRAQDCRSGVCTEGRCQTTSCDDRIRNGAEVDIDCGGGTCAPCTPGRNCRTRADCSSGVCLENVCAGPSCTDDTRNGSETDVDCGGERCGPCDVGAMCASAADCRVGVCTDSECRPASCEDNVSNGDETDVDCGGSCAKCSYRRACVRDGDCVGGFCLDLTCQAVGCDNGIRNGLETGVDCGGIECAPCPEGADCALGTDCLSGSCNEGKCEPSNCADGVLNGQETATDCGGGVCPGCGVGQRCVRASDCASGACFGTTCRAEGCVIEGAFYPQGTNHPTNGCLFCNVAQSASDWSSRNGAPCNDGQFCTLNDTCVSGTCSGTGDPCADVLSCTTDRCDEQADTCTNSLESDSCLIGGACFAAGEVNPSNATESCVVERSQVSWTSTCNDRVRNGTETGIDCGGACGPCSRCGASGELFCADFESGLLSGWTGTYQTGGGQVLYEQSNPFRGSGSGRLWAPTATEHAAFVGAIEPIENGTLYARWYMRFEAGFSIDPSATRHIVHLQASDNPWQRMYIFNLQGNGNVELSNAGGPGGNSLVSVGPVGLKTGAWMCMQVRVPLGQAAATVELTVDGAKFTATMATMLHAGHPFRSVTVGPHLQYLSTNDLTVLVDDFALSTQPIPCD